MNSFPTQAEIPYHFPLHRFSHYFPYLSDLFCLFSQASKVAPKPSPGGHGLLLPQRLGAAHPAARGAAEGTAAVCREAGGFGGAGANGGMGIQWWDGDGKNGWEKPWEKQEDGEELLKCPGR